MKFHCDRCKTRYSITDEKVRGKILKIRCKNCSSVITIREAQEESRPVPAALAGPIGQRSALGDAFERALSKPPTAQMPAVAARPSATYDRGSMEGPRRAEPSSPDPWYISIDGNQKGPFDLDGARRCVAGTRPDEEVYAWTETFDDWLPVAQVSKLRSAVPPSLPPLPGARSPATAVPASASVAPPVHGQSRRPTRGR